jgi:hypothetical protein
MAARQVSWLPTHCVFLVAFPLYLIAVAPPWGSGEAVDVENWLDTVARPHRHCTDFPILLVTSHLATACYSVDILYYS